MRGAKTGPKTPAERQRAYRERKRAANESLLAPPGEPPWQDDQDEDVSLAELNARMRRMAARAFNEVGGAQYLKRVAGKNANTFLRFLGQFVTKDDTPNLAGLTIIVQRLSIESAGPVRGVLASPVAGDVGPSRYLGTGVVIDEEPRDG